MELSGKTILLVEDDQLVGEMLNRRFKIAGAKVIWASDGEDALEKVKTDKMDIIVTDLMMPRLDGFEMLKRIRGNPDTMNVPFMMLTNRSVNEDEVNKMKEAGLDDYVIKSETDLKEVVDRVVAILEKNK